MSDDPNVGLVAIVDWVRVWVLRAKAIVHGEDRNAELERPFSRVVLMCAGVLAAESTAMKVNHCLIKLLSVILRRHRLPVQKSNLDMRLRIVPHFFSVESYILRSDLLPCLLAYLFKSCVGHIIVRERFLHREEGSEHGSVDFLVSCDSVENDLRALLHNLVVVEQVKEEEQILMLVLVRRHPVAELLACTFG